MLSLQPVLLHVLAVVLFLILFIIKACLLFTNQTQTLETFRNKTKTADLLFGILVFITGGYLMFQYNGIPTWLWVKIALVLAAVPVAINGFKKQSKPLVALALVVFVYVYNLSETKTLRPGKAGPASQTSQNFPAAVPAIPAPSENGSNLEEKTAPAIGAAMSETAVGNAKQIYRQQCEACHSLTNKKGKTIGTDLATSTLSLEERKNVILNGRGDMPAYKGVLSEQEAEEIAAFTQMLAK